MTNTLHATVIAGNGQSLSLHDFLISLKRRGRLPSLLREALAEKLVLEAARQASLAVSGAELQQAADRFRYRQGLTSADQTGAACLYQPAPGFAFDPAACPGGGPGGPGPMPGAPVTVRFDNQSVFRGQERPYGPFSVVAGTIFEASITARGTGGDPDLYVRFDSAPTTTAYDCRPYLSTANERCSLTVPAGRTRAFVMVRGFRDGRYNLSVTHTPPATAMSAVVGG